MNYAAEIRAIKGRLSRLEAAQPARRKRDSAPRPTDAVIAARERLWARYVLLHVGHGGRVTRLNFAVKYGLNPSEFSRWLSRSDKRGIPAGSTPDLNFHRALSGAIAELECAHVRTLSHGNIAHSQFSAARPQ